VGDKPLPDKLFFKIGEVADLVGVKPHVLRYWESEFPSLKPMKTRGSHRVYKRRDVEIAMLIRRLLHDEGFTIPGARKRLKQLDRHLVTSEPDPAAAREVALRAELLGVRHALVALLGEIDRISAAPAPARTARVDRVSPASVPVPEPRKVPHLEKTPST
jgi:DNA-binding transcriptional MerR regulator